MKSRVDSARLDWTKQMSSINHIPKSGLQCLTEHNDVSGLFVSRCLNFDLIESGRSWNEAWSNLKIVMKNHIEYFAANHPDKLLNARPADPDLWDKFYQLIRENGSIVEQLSLEIPEPKEHNPEAIWLQ